MVRALLVWYGRTVCVVRRRESIVPVPCFFRVCRCVLCTTIRRRQYPTVVSDGTTSRTTTTKNKKRNPSYRKLNKLIIQILLILLVKSTILLSIIAAPHTRLDTATRTDWVRYRDGHCGRPWVPSCISPPLRHHIRRGHICNKCFGGRSTTTWSNSSQRRLGFLLCG